MHAAGALTSEMPSRAHFPPEGVAAVLARAPAPALPRLLHSQQPPCKATLQDPPPPHLAQQAVQLAAAQPDLGQAAVSRDAQHRLLKAGQGQDTAQA